jgi:hypothetical protein
LTVKYVIVALFALVLLASGGHGALAQTCVPFGSGFSLAACTPGETVIPNGHIISLAPGVTNNVAVRVGDATLSGQAQVAIASLHASATTTYTTITGGVVNVSIPPPTAAATLGQIVTIVPPSGPPLILYAISLGGLPIDASVNAAQVETVTQDGVNINGALFQVGSLHVAAQLQLSPDHGKLTFLPSGTAGLTFHGDVDLAGTSSKIQATVTTDDKTISLVGNSVPGQPLTLSASGAASVKVGGIAAALSNVALQISPSLSITADAQLGEAASSLTFKALHFEVGNRLQLCGGTVPSFTVAGMPDGILKGMSLTAESATFSCDAAGATTLAATLKFTPPATVALSPVQFPMTLSPSGLSLNNGQPLQLIANKDVNFGGVTARIASLGLSTGTRLALTGTFSWSIPSLKVSADGMTLGLEPGGDGSFALRCGSDSTIKPSKTLSFMPICAGGNLAGVSINGTSDFTALNQTIGLKFNNYDVTTCPTGVQTSGDVAVTLPSGSFDFAALTFSTTNATFMADETAGAGCRPVLSFHVAVPTGSVTSRGGHFARGRLIFKGLSIEPSTGAATLRSLESDPDDNFFIAGIGVQKLGGLTLTSTPVEELRIDETTLALPDHLSAGHPSLLIDAHGNDIDDFTKNDPIVFTAKNLAFRTTGVTVDTVTVASDRHCPEDNGMPITDVAKAKIESDRGWFRMPWFDLCFDKPASSAPNNSSRGAALAQAGNGPLQLSLSGRIRVNKLVDKQDTLAIFQAAYTQDIFALRARFENASVQVGGETMIVHAVAVRLEPKYRKIDAEVEIQSHELKNASIFLRHVGFEQTYEVEGTPRPFHVVKTSGWSTKPIVDPDLPRTGASFAARYIPDLIALLGARWLGFKL